MYDEMTYSCNDYGSFCCKSRSNIRGLARIYFEEKVLNKENYGQNSVEIHITMHIRSHYGKGLK